MLLIEGSANLAVLLVKLVVGLTTGSMAVLADAVHSLTDVMNNVVAWFVTRHSAKPADSRHPYGHRKFETLAVFFLAALLAGLAIELAINVLSREPEQIVSGPVELGLMLAVLLVNIGLSTWQRRRARQLDSDILLADASHTFADVLITSTVIVGWQLSAMGYLWLDRLCALAVAVLVLYLAYGLFKRTLPSLLDERAIAAEALRAATLRVDGVRAVRQARSRWLGSSCAVDLVIEVDPQLPTADAHDIADRLEALLAQEFQVKDISIHIEPHR